MTVPDTFQDFPAPPPEPEPKAKERTLRGLGRELVLALLLLAGCALLGLLMGVLWHWLAPKVPLHADATAVYLNDPEGEQAIGADGTFGLLGAGFGLLTGAAAYLATRARQGGISVAVGLGAGGLLGAYLAWGGRQSAAAYQAGVLKVAKSVPTGHTFYGPLQLTTKAVVLIWPILALLTLIALTAAFSPRPTPPPVPWQGPWGPARNPAPDPTQNPAPDASQTPSPEPSQTPAQDGPERA
ncbi:hypothetical protein ACEZCY_07790 [Streptacidiphilus sp. N1-12]|uniref:ABC transporter permease n=2 Tax=Streptacidiphilus alkalitolerans TaxID=3342712 RepID=A0ABV6WAP6_9ACTN